MQDGAMKAAGRKYTKSYPTMNPINFIKNLSGKAYCGVTNVSLNLSPTLKNEMMHGTEDSFINMCLGEVICPSIV